MIARMTLHASDNEIRVGTRREVEDRSPAPYVYVEMCNQLYS